MSLEYEEKEEEQESEKEEESAGEEKVADSVDEAPTAEAGDEIELSPVEDGSAQNDESDGEDSEKPSLSDVADDLPVLPLRGIVVYPMMWLPLTIGQERSIQLVEDSLPQSRIIALVTSKDESIEEPSPEEIYEIGTAAQVHRVLKAPDGTIRLAVQGLERIRLKEYIQEKPYLRARVEVLPETLEEGLELDGTARAVQDLFRRLVELDGQMPDELAVMAANVENARQLAYLVASSMRLEMNSSQEILETDSVQEKLLSLTQLLHNEVDVMELGNKIQSQAQGEMEKMQKDFFLREQIKAIQKELGEEDEQEADIRELEERIEAAGMPEEAHKESLRELNRMRRMPIQAAEYSVIKTYLDLMVSLPWQQTTEDNLDISHARKVLEEDHYGLDEIKDRIVEYLAVRKLRAARKAQREEEEEEDARDKIRREREGVLLCFVGPPGVGKTSLGISIARAMGRKFMRLALGGVRDEAEIRGFRRTYIGSMPGRIIQSLRRVESKNPVFMLDEVDKLGRDFRGDPTSALLEVLDPEQNREFRDHYLDVPFDLSEVMFITTANVLDTIPGPLRDRMEVIQLSSYTEHEKVKIAQQYLVARQIRENGLREGEIVFDDAALRKIVHDYTREAGVRNLEREIGKICRKVAANIAAMQPYWVQPPLPLGLDDSQSQQGYIEDPAVNGEGLPSNGQSSEGKEPAAPLPQLTAVAEAPFSPVHVTPDSLVEYLGKRRFQREEIADRTRMPGVAVGLSWTMTGGEILFFEATKMPGKKGFVLTGQLGDVMKESAQAALSYVRSRAGEMNIPPDFFEEIDIHLHIPEGALPKDGPSAGVTMVTAIASLLTGKSVDPDIGMTGEVTLRGKVLRIGGLKEKVLAAARAGLGTVIMPAANEADLEDLPDNVREQMKFIPVETVDEVLETALLAAPAAPVESPSTDKPDPEQVQLDGEEPEESLERLEYASPSS
ncbi:MAG: endopeptidase La [Caldilineaceae bacterium SB0670_bin_27]|uniref:Lon protease n=1 Tax=Caldilineaceae bacterium SB0664_bin_27 TaxID=2605260 RepID=A0A6B0YX43_9CHLR|nr:endopeptidase La [Caldilineaceae bacterium SB0664_bin_27]MYJ79315.1 endopeptidase La [Caldilineaceae bacterium SB0670_bin_27]